MDLTSLKPSSRSIEIKHPVTEEPVGIRIDIVSIDDDRLKKLKRQIIDASQKLQVKGKFFSAVELEQNANLIMFTASEGWKWYNPTGKESDEGYDADAMPSFHDEVPAYNQKNFVALITELPWVRKQLNDEMEETKAFFEMSGSI